MRGHEDVTDHHILSTSLQGTGIYLLRLQLVPTSHRRLYTRVRTEDATANSGQPPLQSFIGTLRLILTCRSLCCTPAGESELTRMCFLSD